MTQQVPLTSRVKKIIEVDGLEFRDLDGDGQLTPFEDWRLSPAERAADLVSRMSPDEKLGLMVISSRPMGISQHNKELTSHDGVLDEQHLPIKVDPHTSAGIPFQGTTEMIRGMHMRHFIMREEPTGSRIATWINAMNEVAEDTRWGIPVIVAANSKNEAGGFKMGGTPEDQPFAQWPGTLGLAATGSLEVIESFAAHSRREWVASGLRKGYMYMADVLTDPRWFRGQGTLGEDPEFVSRAIGALVRGFQGEDGLEKDGVALTTKHFPGGGARENGFDPHYAAGQWNVYATEGSLQKYHIPTFRPAVKYHAAAIMPYYSKPAAAKSAPQTDCEGNALRMDPYGFAYNKVFIDGILRGQMGFDGYINSDTGITHNMSWGVEALDVPERIGFAVTQSGVDLISGLFDNAEGREAYDRATNGYYDTHPVPEGFKKEDLVLTDESLDRAVARTLTELFQQGMFENPYADPKHAAEAVANEDDWKEAALVHRESVVLLKNQAGTLPLTTDKLSGAKVYAEAFAKDAEKGAAATKALRDMIARFEIHLTDDPAEADYAILMVSPSSGAYFNATPGYLELDICEDKVVHDVGPDGKPLPETHTETTLAGAKRIPAIAGAVHAHGGKVIANINFPLAWMVGNVEPYADALTAGFDTYPSATLDVIFGRFEPVGRLPITLPRGDEVLAVNADGICASPNDVPGYDKDQYIDASLKDENGKAYAYRDAAGNYYELKFGLRY